MRALLPPGVELLRLQSAWNSSHAMVAWLRHLRAVLEPHASTKFFVLLWDTVNCHLDAAVVRVALRSHVHIVLIPAKMTHLPQPLDVYGFAPFKRYLRRRYLEEQLRQRVSVLPKSTWLLLVAEAATVALGAVDWPKAFARCGYGLGQEDVSKNLLEELGAVLPLAVPPGAPDREDLRLCLPGRRLIRPHLDRLRLPPVPEAPAALAYAPPPPALPWFGRTRSTASLAAAASHGPSASHTGASGSAGPLADLPASHTGASGSEGGAPEPIARRTRSRSAL